MDGREQFQSPAARQYALTQFGVVWSAVTVARALTEHRDFDGSTAAIDLFDHAMSDWGERLRADSEPDEFDAAFADLGRLVEIARRFYGDPDSDDVAFVLLTADAAIERARFKVVLP